MSNSLNNSVNSKNKPTCANNCAIESCFFSLPPKQFALLAALFGVVLSGELDINQKNALGNFFLSIGQTILTEAAQEQVLQSGNSQDDNSQNDQMLKEIENLKKQIASIQK